MKKYFILFITFAILLSITKLLLLAKYEIVNGGSSNSESLNPGDVVVSYPAGNKTVYATSNKTIVIVDSTTPKLPNLVSPLNKMLYSRMITFNWEEVVDDTDVTYILEISTVANFSVIKSSFITQTTFYQVEFNDKSEYFWRVGCYDIVSNFSGFTTGQFVLDLGIYIPKNKFQQLTFSPYFELTIPQDSIGEDLQLYFSSDPIHNPIFINKEIIEEANNKLNTDEVLLRDTLIEVVIRNIYGERFISNFNSEVEFGLCFKDNNNDNLVDNHPEVYTKSLKVCVLDENNKVWVKLPSEIDVTNKIVKTKVKHFSVFALIGKKVPKSLNNVYVYPNPYKPSYGINYIVFANLTLTTEIKIFNIAGELVDTLKNEGNDSEEKWYLPKNLASGVYIYLATDREGNKKVGKFAVIK